MMSIHTSDERLVLRHNHIKVVWQRGHDEPTITGAEPGDVKITRDSRQRLAHITVATYGRCFCNRLTQSTSFYY